MPSSRVRDGICDCCDGADEAGVAGAADNVCANTCDDVGREWRQQMAAALGKLEVSSAGNGVYVK